MSFDGDDDILQDFLVEAGEILEQLAEQLVDLEQRPSDKDLLNAVFRGFHTIKGGASFLNLTSLVEVCHIAEDVFNLLRQGERDVDAHLMDVMLRVLDAVNDMFGYIRNSDEPPAADATLLAQLNALKEVSTTHQTGDAASTSELLANENTDEVDATDGADEGVEGDITDEEFERLLDALHDGPPATTTEDNANDQGAVEGASDEIDEDEFEALLDKLHGKGKHGGTPVDEAASGEKREPPTEATVDGESDDAPKNGVADDEITEEEFEALLDKLHGKNQHPGTPLNHPTVDSGVKPSPGPEEQAAAPRASDDARMGTAPAKQGPKDASPVQSETTVRVDTRRLDDIMNMVGELVLVRNRLVTLESALGHEQVAQAIANLTLVTADLQAAVMKTRMQPIKKVFGRFPRVVRDLARGLNKEVNLEMQGEDTDLDKNLVEALADPLVHLVRNAVDHGLEPPDERAAAGKPRAGHVLLAAEQEGDHILLTISDDGRGIDADVLRRKAVEKGVLDAEAAARLDEKEVFNLIFAPGFSTKTEISDISGRGVGMDVVKTRIVQLNGSIEIESKKGVGSRFLIKVPLTLAIMPTLMVMLGKQIFAFPLVSVSEIFNLDLTHTNTVDGQLVIMVRDKPLPLFFLKQWLVRNGTMEAMPDSGHVVVVNLGSQRVGFVVEHLIGQEEVVIKPLGALLQGIGGLAGATITGDGRIALILDVPGLMNAYARRA